MTRSPRVIAVIQARTGSTRLPGKVLRRLGGRPVLSWMIRAARAADGLDDVVLATSDLDEDDELAAVAAGLGVPVVRGSAEDVLSRFADALAAHPAAAVVRLTADCPLIDPSLVDAVVDLWCSDPSVGYVSTTLVRTLPRGLDVELIRADVLRQLAATASGPDRIHVTSAAYAEGSSIARLGICIDPPVNDLRVTLDTSADADALDAIVERLGDRLIPWREVVALLRSEPDIVALNGHIQQRALEDG